MRIFCTAFFVEKNVKKISHIFPTTKKRWICHNYIYNFNVTLINVIDFEQLSHGFGVSVIFVGKM